MSPKTGDMGHPDFEWKRKSPPDGAGFCAFSTLSSGYQVHETRVPGKLAGKWFGMWGNTLVRVDRGGEGVGDRV